MDDMELYRALPEALIPWYKANCRDLPWRRDRDPYHIWLSEIMLQQTRVEAVKGYYLRFLREIPTIRALAAAEDGYLGKLWEGLGYYSRVRNLKKAAQVLVERYDGQFPRTYGEILALPGIGAYTAGAICSQAFDLPTPAVDGNVLRLAARLTDDDAPVDTPRFRDKVRTALAEVYPPEAGTFTQALMELGATVCGPDRKPDCGRCPCAALCLGRRSGRAEALPVRLPKRARRVEDRTVFILSCDGRYALQKRRETGLLAGLWQFPNCPGTLDAGQALAAVAEMGLRPTDITRQTEKKHIFTHIQWNMRGFYIRTAQPGGEFTWLTAAEINSGAAIPTAFRQFWEETDHV